MECIARRLGRNMDGSGMVEGTHCFADFKEMVRERCGSGRYEGSLMYCTIATFPAFTRHRAYDHRLCNGIDDNEGEDMDVHIQMGCLDG